MAVAIWEPIRFAALCIGSATGVKMSVSMQMMLHDAKMLSIELKANHAVVISFGGPFQRGGQRLENE